MSFGLGTPRKPTLIRPAHPLESQRRSREERGREGGGERTVGPLVDDERDLAFALGEGDCGRASVGEEERGERPRGSETTTTTTGGGGEQRAGDRGTGVCAPRAGRACERASEAGRRARAEREGGRARGVASARPSLLARARRVPSHEPTARSRRGHDTPARSRKAGGGEGRTLDRRVLGLCRAPHARAGLEGGRGGVSPQHEPSRREERG